MVEIGIDCVDITRFTKDIVSKKKIIKKIFTPNEIKYCENKTKPSQHYAVRFAGKEAVIKAFSNYNISIPLNRIEIINKDNKTPTVKLLDNTLNHFEIKISLSHSNNIAMAFAIISKHSN